MVVNSFTLTSPTFDPIGLALHPKSALFNHSCDPNAFVRFDVPPEPEVDGIPALGSISVHTLRPVATDEEITISYIDTTSPFDKRQEELRERYFFNCSCSLCSQGSNLLLDGFRPSPTPLADGHSTAGPKELKRLEQSVDQYLGWLKSTPGIEHQHVEGIKGEMQKLVDSGSWRLPRYPWPQLRKLLFLGLLELEKFDEAFIQCGVLLRRVYPILFKDEHHPVRLMEMWTLFHLCRNLLGTRLGEGRHNGPEIDALACLSCAAIDEVRRLLNVGGRVKGQFERIVDEALQSIKNEPHIWGDYQQRVRSSASAWTWLDQRLDNYLQSNEGLRPQDLSTDITTEQ